MITIILTGPQGSGKSTITQAIEPVIRKLEINGKKIEFQIVETQEEIDLTGIIMSEE